MALEPQTAISNAREALGLATGQEPPELAEARAALQLLAGKEVDEAKTGPAVKKLFQLSVSIFSNPMIRPLLLIEGARIARAIDLLEAIPGTEDALGLLRSACGMNGEGGLTRDQLVELGLGNVKDKKLKEAVEELKSVNARPESQKDLKAAADLITAVADDCAGPLGGVYKPEA
ncbi:MAG TPA: hypothetical protein VN493_01030 [Thermoanaerobaculia bacterium]|nr:hypothetical protein [Thermoanaerobaculia bacterium]